MLGAFRGKPGACLGKIKGEVRQTLFSCFTSVKNSFSKYSETNPTTHLCTGNSLPPAFNFPSQNFCLRFRSLKEDCSKAVAILPNPINAVKKHLKNALYFHNENISKQAFANCVSKIHSCKSLKTPSAGT